MYSATVTISILAFTATNGTISESETCQASFSAPVPAEGTPASIFTGAINGDLIIAVPEGNQKALELVFELPGADYTILGIVFGAPGYVGRTEFPTFTVSRNDTGSGLSVVDSNAMSGGSLFEYAILIQEVSTERIGLIDPRIRTDD